MRKGFIYLAFILLASCGRQKVDKSEQIITVSISPFKYFVEAIAGNDFVINVMVPAGSDPHIYEPFPEQLSKLRNSVAYISNGFLGFEMNWLDRFYETNREMKKLCLGDNIIPFEEEHHHSDEHVEGADPHYWVSPVCAEIIARDVKVFLTELNPAASDRYEKNFENLLEKINALDIKATELFSSVQNKTVMIYHPNLAYIARDYGLTELAVEFEGKEPSPSRLRELIDLARKDNIKTIFIQREYDKKNAKAIADEIGASLLVIDPLSEDWLTSTSEIINSIYMSLTEGVN